MPFRPDQPSRLQSRLFNLAWPIILQIYLFQMTGVVDNLMVGQFGEQTIAALGICLQLNFFVIISYAALTQGGAVMTAQFRGARNREALRETVATLIIAGFLIGLLLCALYLFAGEWLLSLLTTDLFRPPEQRSALPGLGYEYLAVISVGVLFMAPGQIAMHLLQALGDTRTPMRLALYANVFNVVGNYIFLFGGAVPGLTGPLFEPMGLRGVAIATSLAWCGQTLMMLATLLRHEQVALSWRDLRGLVWTRLRRVLHIGYPLSLDGFLWQGSAFVYAMMFNHVGAEAYAAFLIALIIRSLSLAPGAGYQQAIAIAVGQSLGANHRHRARAYVRAGLRSVSVVLPLLGLILWLLAPWYLQLYDITPETRSRIIWMVGFGCLYSLATAMTITIPGVLRSGGDTKAPMVITTLGFAVIGLPLSYLLGIHLGFGLWGVFAGFAADEIAKAIIMRLYLRRETWLNNLARDTA
ncbi:MAG: MATE family efflux transporter [Natronospirillum sp.]|uniref:MATE family efflux transporter n=1 Tax=Natronospirillum sp. TaxID=2812955 RepID=UPI0025DE1966|nr:MATE family efflux transporter [Natronospirillum sp.]MCH8552461.1 MATE family efflux transporter [Natronospirillum sp.]